jgi:hypothetical protein
MRPRHLLMLPLVAIAALTAGCGNDNPPTPTARSAPTTVAPDTPVVEPHLLNAYELIAARKAAFFAAVQAENERKWYEAVAAEEQRQYDEAQRQKVAAAVEQSGGNDNQGGSSSGHDPCAEPISGDLPDNIVQRESHGQCDAYNHGGCGGRGCLGWAQIDEGHFSADSPWGSGPGSCYGLSYNQCVSKLSNGGTNLDPWKCC